MSPGNPAVAALAVFVAYTVLVGVLWRLTGTCYYHLVDSRSTILRGIVLPIGLGGLLLAVMTTWFGWWEKRPAPRRVGTVLGPHRPAAVRRGGRAQHRGPSTGGRPRPGSCRCSCSAPHWWASPRSFASRCEPAVGLRESGASEVTVWLVTSILFALLHGMNVLFGQSGRTTLLQVVAAFFAGTVLYITMMTTGSLIVAMVLHALWDFGTLGILATDRQQKPVAGILALANFLIAAGTVGFVLAAA